MTQSALLNQNEKAQGNQNEKQDCIYNVHQSIFRWMNTISLALEYTLTYVKRTNRTGTIVMQR